MSQEGLLPYTLQDGLQAEEENGGGFCHCAEV